jgi:hypothetical protein
MGSAPEIAYHGGVRLGFIRRMPEWKPRGGS